MGKCYLRNFAWRHFKMWDCWGWLSTWSIALLALSSFPSFAQTGPQQQVTGAGNIAIQRAADSQTTISRTVNKIAQSLTDADAARFARLIAQAQHQLSAADRERLKKLSEELGMTKEAVAGFFRILGQVRTKGRVASLDEAAGVLYQEGEEKGNNDALKQAIAIYRALLSRTSGAFAPLDWAATQSYLGNALVSLGEVEPESNTAQLKEAIAAYREALKVRTREHVPLDWAMTQNNLGNALVSLGEVEIDMVLLEEAIAAYREALKEWTREREPVDWAMTQNNLGVALWNLGERESGTVRLEEAIAAYREALKERTRERVPLDWAMTQNNLGIALLRLSGRENSTARLEQAVAAYHDALKERTRERVPWHWAETQNYLGNALASLGTRESDTAHLEEAIAAYKAALTVLEPANADGFAKRNLAWVEAFLKKRQAQSGPNEKTQIPK